LEPSKHIFDTHTPDAFPVGKILYDNFHRKMPYYGYIITKIFQPAPVYWSVYGKLPFDTFYKHIESPNNSNAALQPRGRERDKDE